MPQGKQQSYFRSITDKHSIITAIDDSPRFPETLLGLRQKYIPSIQEFIELINSSRDSGEILEKIRSSRYTSQSRMPLLKIFRRCVSPVLDTEATKKVNTIRTSDLIKNYGNTFKPIELLSQQFNNLSDEEISALSSLLGEYDKRGQIGYKLTSLFFDWFESSMPEGLRIMGPRGAGRDIELSSILADFHDSYPCDFIIKDNKDNLKAVGFARYDSTRGGAQSDDRTGGNSNKVDKAINYHRRTGRDFKIIFLSDGPGLAHVDTWEETCQLDDSWEGRVRVTTLKTAQERVTTEWLCD